MKKLITLLVLGLSLLSCTPPEAVEPNHTDPYITEEVLSYPAKTKKELKAERKKANKKARLYNYKGKMLSIKEIAKRENKTKTTIYKRIKKNGTWKL